jgi:uncharacterized protein
MRLVYATDLHGNASAYELLAQFAQEQHADVVILGGDWFAYSPTAASQRAFAEGPLWSFLEDLSQASIPVLAISGNVDRPAAIRRVEDFECSGHIRILTLQPYLVALPGKENEAVAFIGYPFVPPMPFRIKDHERRDLASDHYDGPWPILISSPTGDGPVEAPADYLEHLPSIEEDLAAVPEMDSPCIFVAHTPPRGVIDLGNNGIHAGSHAVSNWIRNRQPLLSLHGHIHEAPDCSDQWAARIGSTICVNPGPTTATQIQFVVAETTTLPHHFWHTCRGDNGL